MVHFKVFKISKSQLMVKTLNQTNCTALETFLSALYILIIRAMHVILSHFFQIPFFQKIRKFQMFKDLDEIECDHRDELIESATNKGLIRGRELALEQG